MTKKNYIPLKEVVSEIGYLVYKHLWEFPDFRRRELDEDDINYMLRLPNPERRKSLVSQAKTARSRDMNLPESIDLLAIAPVARVNQIDTSPGIKFGELNTLMGQIDMADLTREEAIVVALLYVMEAFTLSIFYRPSEEEALPQSWVEIPPAKLLLFQVMGFLDIENGAVKLEPVGNTTDLSFDSKDIEVFISDMKVQFSRSEKRRGGAQVIHDWEQIDRLLIEIIFSPDDGRVDTEIAADVAEILKERGMAVPDDSGLRKKIRYLKSNLL